MRNIARGLVAVVLVFSLATIPVTASIRTSGSSIGILQTVKHFVVRVMSRISPPGGAPVQPPPETTDTQSKST